LPLRKLELTGRSENNYHRLNWEIDADEAVIDQVLETSDNGRDFHAAGNLSVHERNTVSTISSGAQNQMYRLRVTFDNGRTHYSNTISLRNNLKALRPVLRSNMVGNELFVSMPQAGQYMIFDHAGKMHLKGVMGAGIKTIQLGNLNNGLYIVQFNITGNLHAERFLKQ
jgi:hypothetical protein